MLILLSLVSYLGLAVGDVAIADAPYFVTVELDNSPVTDGALLAANWVVVAGRSITWFTDDDWQNHVTVRAGSDRRSMDGQTKKTLNHTWHDLFDANAYDYNVALLELDGGFNLGENVQTVSLGTSAPSAGLTVDVTAYGSLPDQGNIPDRLQQFNVTTIARLPCNIAYQDYLDEIMDRNICGGMPEGEVCYGESGAPITLDGNLVALYASSLGCDRDGIPAIFTNLLHPDIKQFIEDKIKT